MPMSEPVPGRSRTIHAAVISLEERAKDLSLEQILRATLDEAEALTGSHIGFYHFVEEDQENLLLQAWSTRTEAEFCTAEGKGMHYPVSKAGVWADCLRVGHPLIQNDYQNVPNRKGLPPGHATVLRELVVPVKRSGRVVAVLGVGNKLADYDEADIESVQLLADLAWHLAASKRMTLELENSLAKNQALIQANRATNPQVATLIRLMVGLGLRESEALEARWKWLDPTQRTYTVGRSKTRTPRTIPVPSWLWSHILDMPKALSDFICPCPDGTAHRGQFTKITLARAAKDLRIIGITPHSLRRTFATLHAQAGTSLADLQGMMGHTSPVLTLLYPESVRLGRYQ